MALLSTAAHSSLFFSSSSSKPHNPTSSIHHPKTPNSISLLSLPKQSLPSPPLPVRGLVAKITAEEDGRPSLCIVSKIFFGWASDVAVEIGTRNFTFSVSGAYGTLAYVSIWNNLPHREATDPNSDEFAVPGFPDDRRFHITQLNQLQRKADGEDPWSRFFRTQFSKSMKNSHGWLCNSVGEIEPLGFKLLREYSNRRIWAIGPLLPPELLQISGSTSTIAPDCRRRSGKTPGVSSEKCIKWLDSHDPGSVLYISATLASHQASGLNNAKNSANSAALLATSVKN